MLCHLLKIIFFALIVRPLVLILLGLNVINRRNLPFTGPVVIAANHNSHLDAIVLMSLFPLLKLYKVRPVAAADYFLKNRFLAWFSLNVVGIIPIRRGVCKDPDMYFSECRRHLEEGDILIVFPEGTRGEPEQMGHFKKGLYYLLEGHTDVPVIPVMMRGLGMSLPKGEALLVPFNCDVIIGDQLKKAENSNDFVKNLSNVYNELSLQCLTRSELKPH